FGVRSVSLRSSSPEAGPNKTSITVIESRFLPIGNRDFVHGAKVTAIWRLARLPVPQCAQKPALHFTLLCAGGTTMLDSKRLWEVLHACPPTTCRLRRGVGCAIRLRRQ